jgi:hypothetical protein
MLPNLQSMIRVISGENADDHCHDPLFVQHESCASSLLPMSSLLDSFPDPAGSLKDLLHSLCSVLTEHSEQGIIYALPSGQVGRCQYVFDYVPGDGVTFDYGVDYTECGTVKFLREQGAPELAPYLCPADILYSQALGWGLKRTTTLAERAERCDFRFKKDGETQVAVPEPLEKWLRSRQT